MTHSAVAECGVAEFGSQLRRLLEARGLSQRKLARLVPCDAGYLSKLINGQKRPSPRIAAVMDEVLDGHGTLTACVPAPKRPARSRRRREPANPGGISLTLPCAHMCLVIEISVIGETAEIVRTGDELPGGQATLMLVRDQAQEGGKR